MNLPRGTPGPRRKVAVAVTRDPLQRIWCPQSTGTPQEQFDRLHNLIGPRAMRALGRVGEAIELLLGNPAGPIGFEPQAEAELEQAEADQPEAEAEP